MNRSSSVTVAAALLAMFSLNAPAHLNREKGNGPNGIPESTFFEHHLSTDHGEGIASTDINGAGQPDLISGAYWYQNPGPQGGEWKRHQYRIVEFTGEFVSDCGEWAIDVNHDGAIDLVTVGWQSDAVW